MATAAKSLLYHTRMDRVWFLIEDDAFPEPLPEVIKTKNVSGQKWFDPDGPNARKRWSYMALMKLALPEVFPEEERLLWLDVDTVVNKDIGDLFETDLGENLVAAAEEPMRSRRPFMYFNAGVLLMDTKKLAAAVPSLVKMANGHPMDFPDQDAINLCLQGRIQPINPTYNSNYWIVEVPDPHITHYAAERQYERHELWQQYEKSDWRVL